MATSPETAEVASVSNENENGREQLKANAVDVTEENEDDKASNGSFTDSDTSNDTKNGGELDNPAGGDDECDTLERSYDDDKVDVTDDSQDGDKMN